MSHFEKDYDDHGSAKIPPEELLEAFEVFQVIPSQCRAVYLMHQSGVAFPQIAKTVTLDIDEVESQHDEAENALYCWASELLETQTQQPLAEKLKIVEPQGRDAILGFLSDIVLKLLFFDETVSPPPQLEEIGPLIFWVRMTLGFYNLQEQQFESAKVISLIPHMTPSEMRIADQWLFSLDASVRETVMLSLVANIAPPIIAEIQGISETEASSRIMKTEILQGRYMQDLLTRWLRTKHGFPDANPMNPDETKTAKLLWKRLAGPYREVLQNRILGHDTTYYEPDRLEEQEILEAAVGFMQSYFDLLVLGWCQIALNGIRDEKSVCRAAAQTTLLDRKVSRKSDVVAFAVRLLDYEVREAFLLSWSMEPEWIARQQNTSPGFVDLRIREAWMVLHKRFEWIVTQRLRRRIHGSDAAKERPPEKKFAQKIVKRIPKRYRDALARSLLTNDSNHVIAKDLGLSMKTVARYIAKGKANITKQIDRLVGEYFMRSHKGISVAEKFLKEMWLQKRRHEIHRGTTSPNQRKSDIVDELKTILSEIPMDDLTELRAGRIAFFLTRGCGAEIDEIPEFYGADATYLRNACDKVVKYLHHVVERHVYERLQQDNPFLVPPGTTGAIGSQAMKAVSREQLEIYRRYHVAGESESNIAKAFSVSEDVVSKTLTATRTRFHEIVEEFMALLLNRPSDFRPEFQSLNQDISTALTTQNLIEQNRALKDKTLEITDPPMSLIGVIEPVLDIPIKSSVQGIPTTRSVISHFSLRDTIASAPKLLTPLFGFPTLDSASKSLWGVVTNAFMLVAIPFLWVMSLAISGQALGYAFVRNAPTLQIRRWIVKQLFWCYALIFIVPLGIATFNGIISAWFNLNPGQQTDLTVISVAIYCGVLLYVLGYLIKLNKKWATSIQEDEFGNFIAAEDFQEIAFSSLKSFIHRGFVAVTIFLVAFISMTVTAVILPAVRANLSPLPSICLVGTIVILQSGAYFMFRYFLNISENEIVFHANPPMIVNSRKVRMFSEFLYVFPFALFPIWVGLFHFSYSNTRPIITSLEMLVCSLWWSLIWFLNTKSAKRRWIKILLSFAIQFVTMLLLRIYVLK